MRGGSRSAVSAFRILLAVNAVSLGAIGARCSSIENSTSGRVLAAADSVLTALEAKDGERLALLVHPIKGVRFSSSAFVNPHEDITLTSDQIRGLWSDSQIYRWGYEEGSGDPIALSPSDYVAQFVLDRDYRSKAIVSVNDGRAFGTMRNNAAEIYSIATRVEYYIPPSNAGHWTGQR